METRPTLDCSLTFPPHPAWVRTARDAVRTLLTAGSRPDLTDAAVTLTSETVTNAINACQAKGCGTPVTLVAEWIGGDRLRVLVHDGAIGLPVRRPVRSVEEESGRGLMLVEHASDAWGVCAHGPGPGKAIWFVLGGRDRPEAGPARSAKSPIGCTDCAELEAARRAAVAGSDREKVVDATVAVRSHFRDAHILPVRSR